jgi:hypothetical protein
MPRYRFRRTPASAHVFNETFLFAALVCATAVLAAWRMQPVPTQTAAR